jgi:maltose-binding protein MalE
MGEVCNEAFWERSRDRHRRRRQDGFAGRARRRIVRGPRGRQGDPSRAAWKGGGAEPANVAEINKAFEAAHPDIEVDFEYITANDTCVQKLQPELLGGKAGDVIMVDTDKMKKWGASGYLADLSGESWANKIAPDAKPFAQADGKTLAMPMELIGIDLYANMDLLKKAGITEVPADWPPKPSGTSGSARSPTTPACGTRPASSGRP